MHKEHYTVGGNGLVYTISRPYSHKTSAREWITDRFGYVKTWTDETKAQKECDRYNRQIDRVWKLIQ